MTKMNKIASGLAALALVASVVPTGAWARWGDLEGEKNEIEAPRYGDLIGETGFQAPRAQAPRGGRWGDLEGEKNEIEAPRFGGKCSGQETDGLCYPEAPRVQAPRSGRWGDLEGEKNEIEAPRWGDLEGEKNEIEAPRAATAEAAAKAAASFGQNVISSVKGFKLKGINWCKPGKPGCDYPTAGGGPGHEGPQAP